MLVHASVTLIKKTLSCSSREKGGNLKESQREGLGGSQEGNLGGNQ